MEITEVKVFLVDEEKLKGFVSIVLDRCFMINDIKVIQGREGLFISMPSRRKKNGEFKDVAHPLNNETRRWMEDAILSEYRRARSVRAESGDGGGMEVRAKVRARTPAAPASPPVQPPGEPLERSAEAKAPRKRPAGDEDPGRDEERLDKVHREHLRDSFWSVG